ncbi:MAG: M56 family metallopeptidase [Thermodesulfobacteriota bacterium]
MVFPFIFIAAVAFISGSFFWLWTQAPQLEGLAAMVFEWCRSMAVSCTSATTVVMASLMWAGAALLGGGVLYAFVRQGRGLLKGSKAMRRLPLSGAVGSVALIRDDTLKTAFTCGLIRPRIYLSTGLLKALTREELRSVLLHEAHHRRNRDPLRFFLAAFLKDVFFYLPIAGYLAGVLHSLKEKAADESVVSRTKDPLNLAGALVKVALSGGVAAGASTASFRGASVEGRVRRLVEGTDEAHPAPGAWTVLSSSIVAAVVVLSLFLPMAAHGQYRSEFCTKAHCSMKGEVHYHIGSPSHTDCKTHCKTMKHPR